MRVCINYLEEEQKPIAPFIFSRRLAQELQRQGVQIVSRRESHDILLAVIRDEHVKASQEQGAKVVQRLDGVYHELDENIAEKNRTIYETFQQVDAVIYQSDFSRQLVGTYFNQHSGLEFVIHNGVDPEAYRNRTTGKTDHFRFLASAKWVGRPNKRLDSIIAGFLEADMEDAELVIAGQTDPTYQSKGNIILLGAIAPEDISEVYAQAQALIHLCYDDNCPNAVVEGLVAGLPVICTSSGGTPELVKESGIIIPERPYDLKPNWRKDIPSVPAEQVAKAMHELREQKKDFGFPRTDLYIENCAREYIRAFERILEE